MRLIALPALLFSLLAVIACSSSGKQPADQPAGTNPPASSAPTGRTGYITAVNAKLQDTVLDGKTKMIASFDDGSALMDPALSPDGKRVAFIRQEPVKNLSNGQIDFGADLYVVNRDGSGLKELAHHSDLAEYIRGPSWLDDGQLLFSVRGRDKQGSADYRLERIDVASGQRTRMNQYAVDPSVTPGAKQLLFVSVESNSTRETLMLANVDGSNARDLLPQEPQLTLIGSAVMSPDGTQIAFAAGDLTGASLPGTLPRSTGFQHPFFQDVWLINADGTNLHRVAELVEKSLSLSWSPDGKSIYAMGTEKFRRIDLASGSATVISEGAPFAGITIYEQK